MRTKGSKILSSEDDGSLSASLLRVLSNVTDVADQLERDSILLEQALKYIEIDEWSTKATEMKDSIKSELVTKVNSLFARVSNATTQLLISYMTCTIAYKIMLDSLQIRLQISCLSMKHLKKESRMQV